jgi:hypothetical protein
MKPIIQKSKFGSITIENVRYPYDVLIRLDGKVKKRKKKLSKKVYGTSHLISLEEIKFIHSQNTEMIIFGAGQHGQMKLSPEAEEFLGDQNCDFILKATPQAIKHWNNSKGKVIGLFHVTC